MKVRADLSVPAVVATDALPWVASPMPGVSRRMLDRDGGEVARCTSIVRFEAAARFPHHRHGGGEEFLVLDGVFSDEAGDYPAGCYVRHPVGSEHSAWSREGCTILVKLMQMDAADQELVVIDTDGVDWQATGGDGISVKPLHRFGDERAKLIRFAPGAVDADHDHPGGEEMFVLAGELSDEHGDYPAGAWVRSPAGSRHRPRSESGCTLFVKTGHLAVSR